jgi:hypothetical protein
MRSRVHCKCVTGDGYKAANFWYVRTPADGLLEHFCPSVHPTASLCKLFDMPIKYNTTEFYETPPRCFDFHFHGTIPKGHFKRKP